MSKIQNLIIFLIIILALSQPAQAMQYRLNFLLSGIIGLGISAAMPFDDFSNIEAGIMYAIDPDTPIFFDINYKRYLGEKGIEQRGFAKIGYQRIASRGRQLDFIKIAGGTSNPFDWGQKIEASLICAYYLDKNMFIPIGIETSYKM